MLLFHIKEAYSRSFSSSGQRRKWKSLSHLEHENRTNTTRFPSRTHIDYDRLSSERVGRQIKFPYRINHERGKGKKFKLLVKTKPFAEHFKMFSHWCGPVCNHFLDYTKTASKVVKQCRWRHQNCICVRFRIAFYEFTMKRSFLDKGQRADPMIAKG